MANEDSPVFEDLFLNSVDCTLPDDLCDVLIDNDFNSFLYSFDYFLWDDKNNQEAEEIIFVDRLLSDSSFDLLENIPDPSTYIDIDEKEQHNSSIDTKPFSNVSLSFLNPPETIYHVRYLSEITNTPPDNNIVNPRTKTKKNLSGRYIKGMRGRYITISIPTILSDNSHLFIRVTRLTVPYDGMTFIHPYSLLYAYPKKKINSYVIIQGSSIFYKINKEEICSQSKRFPNLIFTRLKQCHLKQMNYLYSFDENETPYPFNGESAKNKIAIYQLKKSQLDFRLVIRNEKTDQFVDTNIYCRSNELLEEEGIELKKNHRKNLVVYL